MHKIKQQHQQQEEDLKHNDSIVSLSSLKYRDYSIRNRSWIEAYSAQNISDHQFVGQPTLWN